ncbi:MAG: HAD family hydrolase [Alloprevotella sp.]|nr:HAD family hydrolase [Alloprevotella sp.]
MTRTVILDFDGTLADTAASVVATFNATLKALSLPQLSETGVRQLIGLPLDETFRRATGSDDATLIEACCDTYRHLFDSIAEQQAGLFPHVRETLQHLHSKGLQLCVASSRSRASLLWLLDRLDIARYISLVLGEEDVPNKKPAPDMVLRILQQTGTPAQDALIVGDTTYDLQMGHSALCPVCGVTYGNHSREQLADEKPEYLIDSFASLCEIV